MVATSPLPDLSDEYASFRRKNPTLLAETPLMEPYKGDATLPIDAVGHRIRCDCLAVTQRSGL